MVIGNRLLLLGRVEDGLAANAHEAVHRDGTLVGYLDVP